MPPKVWRNLPPPPEGLAASLGVNPLQATLLYNRGVRDLEQAESYLSADDRLRKDPSLLPNMERAVARVRQAVDSAETVGVFGDFDTDGTTGAAIITLALRNLGAKVVPYLPSRSDEGHGLNHDAVSALRAQGVSLLITADCGTNSRDEVAQAASVGMATIVTDHHTIQSLATDAVAIINPLRPECEVDAWGLTGAGLAYKLAESLYDSLAIPMPDALSELAALGTVADVGPLVGENRLIVRRGLDLLNRTEHEGLKALMTVAKTRRGTVDTETLAFQLIPRLNAAGRVGDAMLSLELLTTGDPARAEELATTLEQHNLERRRLTDEAVAEAESQVSEQGLESAPILFVQHPGWIPGVLGLVAGRLAERYYRPAVAMTVSDTTARASARSIAEFDIVEAFEQFGDVLGRFGGHARAAGFSAPAEGLAGFQKRITAYAAEKLDGVELVASVDIDAEAGPREIVGENFKFTKAMAPFGEGNPAPVFLARGAEVKRRRRVGGTGAHLSMGLSHGGAQWDAIGFGLGHHQVEPNQRIDLLYTIAVGDWRSSPTLELNVLDFRVQA